MKICYLASHVKIVITSVYFDLYYYLRVFSLFLFIMIHINILTFQALLAYITYMIFPVLASQDL